MSKRGNDALVDSARPSKKPATMMNNSPNLAANDLSTRNGNTLAKTISATSEGGTIPSAPKVMRASSAVFMRGQAFLEDEDNARIIFLKNMNTSKKVTIFVFGESEDSEEDSFCPYCILMYNGYDASDYLIKNTHCNTNCFLWNNNAIEVLANYPEFKAALQDVVGPQFLWYKCNLVTAMVSESKEELDKACQQLHDVIENMPRFIGLAKALIWDIKRVQLTIPLEGALKRLTMAVSNSNNGHNNKGGGSYQDRANADMMGSPTKPILFSPSKKYLLLLLLRNSLAGNFVLQIDMVFLLVTRVSSNHEGITRLSSQDIHIMRNMLGRKIVRLHILGLSLVKGFSGNYAGDGPIPVQELHIATREDGRNRRILEQRQLRFSVAERARNSATRRSHRARVADMHRNLANSSSADNDPHNRRVQQEIAREMLQNRRMRSVLQRRNAYAGLLPEELRSFTTNANTALLYWHAIQAPCMEGDLPEYLLPISDSEKDIRIRKFHKHMHPDELYGCACCGVRVIRDYEEDWPSDVALSQLACLKVNEEQLRAYVEDGTYSFKNIISVRSNNIVPEHRHHYFLHRRYLTVPFSNLEDDNEALVNDTLIKARLCNPCRLKCQIGQVPVHSIAKGVDYGGPIGLKLPTLSLLESLLIQKTRIFCHILKLSGGKREYALTGHCIASATDAAHSSSTAYNSMNRRALPDTDIARIGFSVVFIGKLDKWRRITNQRRINEIIVAYGTIFYIKWENIMTWLKYLKVVNPYYTDIIIDESRATQALIEALPATILLDAHITENDTCISIDATLRTANLGCPQLDEPSDLPGVSSVPAHICEDDEEVASSFVPIQHVLLESGIENTPEECTILQSTILSLSALVPSDQPNTVHPDLSRVDPPLAIGHNRDLLNTYTEMKFLMSTGFPALFPLGYPFGDWPPSPQQLIHMLTQATNNCASNLEFIMFSFNIRSRSHVAKAVAARWRASPSSIQKLQDLLLEPNFIDRLKTAAVNPNTESARNILKVITPLIVLGSKNVPYGSSGRSTLALTHMIAMHRFFGSTMSWFFTMNPNMTNHDLSYRLSTPVTNNWERENPLIPATNIGRRDLLEGSPIGPSLAYTRLYHAVWNILFNFPTGTLTTPTPACFRTRGIIGQVSGYYSCQETSNAGYQHQHCQIYVPLNWTVLRTCIHNPELNRNLGVYVDSILWSEMRYNCLHGWGLKDVAFADPLDIHEALATPTYNTNVYLYRACFQASKIQNHSFHNHSCWKNKTADHDKCRFKLPAASWNQESGVIALMGVFDVDNKLVGSKICCSIPSPDATLDIFCEDTRVLVFESTKRSSDDVELRTFADLAIGEGQRPGQFQLDNDPSSANGFFAPCIQAITATTHDQNNLQIVNATMGAAQYIAKYIAKGDGTKLHHSLSLFYEAVRTSSLYPSTALDAESNPLRAPLRVLNRIINNDSRACEFSMRLMLNSLLGEDQFKSSHSYRYVYVNAARMKLISCIDSTSQSTESQNTILSSTSEIRWVNDLVEDDYQGEFVRRTQDSVAELILVTQYDDYRYRPIVLECFNLIEFACICQKKIKAPGSSNDSTAVDTNDSEFSNLPRGRRFNASYLFQTGHPQYATHRLMISSTLGVPILTGSNVPHRPKMQVRDNIADSEYLSQLQDFGSYFVTLLCPWDIISGAPPYELSYDGLMNFIYQLTNIDNIPEETISINAGRLRYMQNCTTLESPLSRYHSDVSAFHRERNATTYAAYQAHVKNNCAPDSHFERTFAHDSVDLDTNANNISDLIDDLRSRFDLLDSAPISAKEKQQLQKNDITCLNIIDLFGINHSTDVPQNIREHLMTFATTSLPVSTLTGAWNRLIQATYDYGPSTILNSVPLPHNGAITHNSNVQPPGLLALPLASIPLNVEQNTILSRWANMSIQKLELITGMPGTGKTFLASRITDLYGVSRCRVIAPTGKAADLHDGGNTAHSAFALPIADKHLKPLSIKQATIMRQKFKDMQILIIDEISMLHASYLPMISDRLQELFPHSNGKDFAGISVLLLGDFLQLPPVGSWLIDHAISGKSTAAILFRKFRHTILRQQMRAAEDPIHTSLLERLSDPIAYPYPLKGLHLFANTCMFCCPSTPTLTGTDNICSHLKVLTPSDTLNDVRWSDAIITSPTNIAVNKINWERLVAFAKNSGQPIIRWRLPSLGTNANLRLGNAIESQHVDLFGYYVKDAPIKITFNANVDIGISNGTTGTLHGLVPVDTINLSAMLESYTPGLIITLDPPPLAILIELPTQRHPDRIPSLNESSTVFPLLVNVKDIKRKLVLNLGKDANGKLEYAVMGAGYTIAFACTVYGLQGSTLSRIILDLNYNPSMPNGWSLAALYVALSRVSNANNIRVLPWLHNFGTHHLENLAHDPRYSAWMNAYDVDGRFQPTYLIRPCPINKIATPTRSRRIPGVPTSISSHPLRDSYSHTSLDNTNPHQLNVISPHLITTRMLPPTDTMYVHSPHSLGGPSYLEATDCNDIRVSLDIEFLSTDGDPVTTITAPCITSVPCTQVSVDEVLFASYNTHSWAYVVFLSDVMQYPPLCSSISARATIKKFWSPELSPLSDYESTVEVARHLFFALDIYEIIKQYSKLPNHIDAPEQELLMGHIQALSSRPDYIPARWLRNAESVMARSSALQMDLDTITIRVDMAIANLKHTYRDRISLV